MANEGDESISLYRGRSLLSVSGPVRQLAQRPETRAIPGKDDRTEDKQIERIEWNQRSKWTKSDLRSASGMDCVVGRLGLMR